MNLKRARELCEAATPGPWSTQEPTGKVSGFTTGVLVAATAPGKGSRIYAEPQGGTFPAADRDFIVAARTLLPEALDRIEALERLVEEARDIIGDAYISIESRDWLSEARAWLAKTEADREQAG